MSPVSWLIFGAIMAAFFAAIIHTVRSARRGECVGCSGCRKKNEDVRCKGGSCPGTGSCPHCNHTE